MANLYFDESLSAAELVSGNTVTLGGAEGRHAVRVSRLRLGEKTLIGNGRGRRASAEVIALGRESCQLRLIEVVDRPPANPAVVLVQALAKGDHAERAVALATEFGVSEVVPWQAARSVVRWDAAKAAAGQQKWQRVAREAAKQSLALHIPEILPLASTQQLCALAREHEMLLLHPTAVERLSQWRSASAACADTRKVFLVVGPEGGFAADEIAQLSASGAAPLRLGETVLRTSSAGAAALAVLQTVLGKW